VPPADVPIRPASPALWAGFAVVVVSLTVVAVLWVVPVLNRTPSAPSPPANELRTPLGAALALAAPSEAATSTNNWYNFSVESAANDLLLGNLSFQIETVSGLVVNPSGSWTLSVLTVSGTTIGSFSMVSASWIFGSTLAASAGEVLCLDAVGTPLSGDDLVVAGTGSFTGSITVVIP
jgi:hypothetical protein